MYVTSDLTFVKKTGTDPSNLKKKQKLSDEFIFSNDGRLIINDDIQLEKTEGKKDLSELIITNCAVP